MNRNFVVDGEAVDATIQALFSEVADQLSGDLYYKQHGFTEYAPDIPEEKLSTVSGFGRASLTVAGQQYGSNQRYKGYSKALTLRKYTSEIDFSEEDIHWLNKAPNTKRVMEFRDNVDGAVNALNAAINLDCAKMFYLAHATTFLNLSICRHIVEKVKSFLIKSKVQNWITNSKQIKYKIKNCLIGQLKRLSERTLNFLEMQQSELGL